MRLLPAESAVIVSLPAIIKASEDSKGRRMVECEASNDHMDAEGDIIEQKALLESAKNFISNGHCDLNHYSELHSRLNLPGLPSDYILGYPREVKDLGKGRTGVVSEIRRSADGKFDPNRNRFDAFWLSLKSDPPVQWRASIYGFPDPDGVTDCREKSCTSGAERFHIYKMAWKSLAFTMNPVNDAIEGCVKIVSAKAFVEGLLKSYPFSTPSQSAWDGNGPSTALPGMEARSVQDFSGIPVAFFMSAPMNLIEAVGQYHTHMHKCEHCGGADTLLGFKAHFQYCCGMDENSADLYSHALKYHLLLENRRR